MFDDVQPQSNNPSSASSTVATDPANTDKSQDQSPASPTIPSPNLPGTAPAPPIPNSDIQSPSDDGSLSPVPPSPSQPGTPPKPSNQPSVELEPGLGPFKPVDKQSSSPSQDNGAVEDIFASVDPSAKSTQNSHDHRGIDSKTAPSYSPGQKDPSAPADANAVMPDVGLYESKSTGPAKKIIAILVIVIVLSGIGFASWWMFFRDSSFLGAGNENSTTEDPVNNDNAEDDDLNDVPIVLPSKPDTIPTAPKDTDDDGLTDEEEIILGTSLSSPDTDNDGLFDREEVKIYKTDPLKSDTDGDGFLDGEEIVAKTDPLVKETYYLSRNYKIEFEYLDDMVSEYGGDNVLLFSDNVRQIKLYVYFDGSEPDDLRPDVRYFISEDRKGQLVIDRSEYLPDETPVSTELTTSSYVSSNGHSYLIYYKSTRKSDSHLSNFEYILKTVRFLP